MKVGLIFNLKTKSSEEEAEWDSIETINAVASALEQQHEVIRLEVDETIFERLRAVRPDIVFNMAEGSKGPYRESLIPSMLEFLDIPYTGSDPCALNLCLNKVLTKQLLIMHGIATPHFQLIDEHFSSATMDYPLIVKPLFEGSSIGIHNNALVHTETELQERIQEASLQKQAIFIEKYLPGREFTVCLIGNNNQIDTLPIIEIRFDSLPKHIQPIYSYEVKWELEDQYTEMKDCPALISKELEKEIIDLSIAAYKALNIRDWCRIDLRLDEQNKVHILELNPLPGILPKAEQASCMPRAARVGGLSYNQLINKILNTASARYF